MRSKKWSEHVVELATKNIILLHKKKNFLIKQLRRCKKFSLPSIVLEQDYIEINKDLLLFRRALIENLFSVKPYKLDKDNHFSVNLQ